MLTFWLRRRSKRVLEGRAFDSRTFSAKHLRQLVLERDKQVVAILSGSSARAAYELGAELDGYIDELMTAARGQ